MRWRRLERDLRDGVRRIPALIAAVVAAGATGRRYAPGRWTARQVVWHIADCETVFLDRLRRILAEERPLLMPFDEDRWNRRLGRARAAVAGASELYAAARADLLRIAATVGDAGLRRVGIHAEEGVVTAAEILAKACRHEAHHAGQLEAILAGRRWRRADPPASHGGRGPAMDGVRSRASVPLRRKQPVEAPCARRH